MTRWMRGITMSGLILVAGCASDAEPAAETEEPSQAEQPVEEETPSEPPAAPEESASDAEATPTGGAVNPLMNPADPEMNHMAPATFRVRMETSRGDVVMEFHRTWSPNGVDRVYNLFRNGFYDGVKFFRVLDGFIAQFGIHGDPRIQSRWARARIPDDQVVEGNSRGRVTFAMGGPNTRSTQLFINFGDNAQLDTMGFAALGEVVEGMRVVESLYSGYGEGQRPGTDYTGPDQGLIQTRGNEYLDAEYPELDYIITAEIIDG